MKNAPGLSSPVVQVAATLMQVAGPGATFDHTYASYRDVLARFVARYGPTAAAETARADAPVRFLPYDWSLNDVDR